MRTERLFWTDPYATRADASVVAIEGNEVEIDRTVFFAFSGGQESDYGTIAGLEVLGAALDGQRIRYTLPENHGLAVGQKVVVEVDWSRRYALMRLHFAAELVLEMICTALPAVERVGAHIAQDKARIDFVWHESLSSLLPSVEERVNAIVRADLPIRSAFSDPIAGRRYWEVDGVARVPCGGTHLRRTGEVGRVLLKRRNPGKGRERVEIQLAT